GLVQLIVDHFRRFPEAAATLADDERARRFRDHQLAYFAELTAGQYDLNYAQSRLAHDQAGSGSNGPGPKVYLGASSPVLRGLLQNIFAACGNDPQRLGDTIAALVKVLFLDIGFAVDVYVSSGKGQEQQLKRSFIQQLTSAAEQLNQASLNILMATSAQSTS